MTLTFLELSPLWESRESDTTQQNLNIPKRGMAAARVNLVEIFGKYLPHIMQDKMV